VRLLLDTHALIWAVDDPAHLGSEARLVLEEESNEVLVSAATVWEIAIKSGLGKLTLSMPYKEWMNTGDCRSGINDPTDHGRVRRCASNSSRSSSRSLRPNAHRSGAS